jgi:hypothetical protein
MGCPKCGAGLKDDYGMQTCPGCGAIVFVDMEGVPHMSDEAAAEAPPAAPPQEPAPELEPMVEMPGAQFMEPMPMEPMPMEPMPMEPMPEPDQIEAMPEAFPQIEPMPKLEVHNEGAPPADDFSMDVMLGYQAPETEAPIDEAVDISAFANSEASQAKDGLLLFRVIIGGPKLGIDSKEMRVQIYEALDDARFGWDADLLMAQINKGVLRIEDLSPVKATIIVNRLKRLPLEIKWEQYLVTQG